jgi:hypothetical protein
MAIGKRKIRKCVDWEDLREKFLKSDKDLYEFCFEGTGDESLPAWSTLQRRAGNAHWVQERIDNRVGLCIESSAKSKAIHDDTHVRMIEERKKLLSADLTIRRHIEIAQSFQALYLDMLPSIQAAAHGIDWQGIAESDPKTYITMFKDLNSVMASAIEIERKSMSLTDIKIELFTESKSSLDITTRDLSKMSEKELTEAYLTSCKQID